MSNHEQMNNRRILNRQAVDLQRASRAPDSVDHQHPEGQGHRKRNEIADAAQLAEDAHLHKQTTTNMNT